MTEFVIRLADERGRVQEQSHAAATAEELRARFTQAGYYVYSVKAKSALGSSKKKVKLETFLIFNQQFLTLIKAGLPILGSLELLAKRQKLPHFRAQLEDVAARVKTGESISQAFEAQGGFPIVYTTTLLAGERSGNLEEVLQRFLDFQRVSLTFRKKLKASLIYPALLVVMVIGLFIFLITFVVPRFAQLYDQLGTKLPALTTFLLDLGREAQEYGIYVAVVVGIVGFLLYRWSKTDAGANLIDKIRISLPVFGPRVVEVPGGFVFEDAVDAADGWVAAGAFAGDGGEVDRFAADCGSGVPVGGDGARGQRAVGEFAGDEGVSGACDRDDRGGRVDGCAAADVELGGGVF